MDSPTFEDLRRTRQTIARCRVNPTTALTYTFQKLTGPARPDGDHYNLNTSNFRSLVRDPELLRSNRESGVAILSQYFSDPDTTQSTYQATRLLILQALPEWATRIWDAQSTASWRRLNLHASEMNRFAKKVSGIVTVAKREAIIPPSSINGEASSDERADFVTFEVGKSIIESAEQLAESYKIPAIMLRLWADAEIRQNELRLASPTPIGRHFRSVAQRELNFLLAARIVDDIGEAFGVPLNTQCKIKLFEENANTPWKIASDPAWQKLKSAVQRWRGNGSDDEHIAAEVLKALRLPSYLNYALQIIGNGAKTSTAPAPTSSITKPQVTQVQLQPTKESLQMYVAFRQALETRGYGEQLESREAAALLRVIGKSIKLLNTAIEALEQGAPLKDAISQVRAKKRESYESSMAPDQESESGEQKVPRRTAVEQVTWSVDIREDSGIDRLSQAGRIRFEKAIKKFTEKPELADRCRVDTVNNVWELRTGKGVRIYYRYSGSHKIEIVLVGDKRTQKLDMVTLRREFGTPQKG